MHAVLLHEGVPPSGERGGTGDENCHNLAIVCSISRMQSSFVKKALERIMPYLLLSHKKANERVWNWSVHEFYRLKANSC